MEVKIIQKPNNTFWEKFDSLCKSCFQNNVQFKSDWLRPYIKNLLTGSVYIIAVYSGAELVGCLPLEKRKKKATRFWNYRVLHILGSGPTDFFEILAQDERKDEILTLVFRHLKEYKSWDYLELNILPQSSDSLKWIKSVFTDPLFKITRIDTAGFCFEKTVGNWDSYFESVFNKKNKDLSKGERRLKADEIEYHFETYRENVFDRFIATVELYASRRETLGQYNYYEDKSYRMFLKNVCENYEKFQGIEFTVMKDSRRDVEMAIQLDFINKNTRYHWNHAFNEDYKRYSPGKILLKEILKNSFEDPNIFVCNHMRGLSKYKETFTSYQDTLPSFRIQRVSSLRIRSTRWVSKVLKFLK